MTPNEQIEKVRELCEAGAVAQRFHEAYERLAPEYGYKTREESAVPWEQVPEQNRALMQATAMEVMVPVFQLVAGSLSEYVEGLERALRDVTDESEPKRHRDKWEAGKRDPDKCPWCAARAALSEPSQGKPR